MPAASLPVDWAEVRKLALLPGVGVREAARQFGVSTAAALKRSDREHWFADRDAAKAALANRPALIATASGSNQPPSSLSSKTAIDALAALGVTSRLHLGIAVSKVARKLSESDAEELATPRAAKVAAAWTGVGAIVHKWQPPAHGVSSLRLELIAGGAVESEQAVDVESVVTRIEGWPAVETDDRAEF